MADLRNRLVYKNRHGSFFGGGNQLYFYSKKFTPYHHHHHHHYLPMFCLQRKDRLAVNFVTVFYSFTPDGSCNAEIQFPVQFPVQFFIGHGEKNNTNCVINSLSKLINLLASFLQRLIIKDTSNRRSLTMIEITAANTTLTIFFA